MSRGGLRRLAGLLGAGVVVGLGCGPARITDDGGTGTDDAGADGTGTNGADGTGTDGGDTVCPEYDDAGLPGFPIVPAPGEAGIDVDWMRMPGDINGDGFSDVLVVDWDLDEPGYYAGTGVAHLAVVFGKADGDSVWLADVLQGRKGFPIRGIDGYQGPYARLYWEADGLGDFNGDGFDDFAFAGFAYDAPVYVVFGSQDPVPLDVEDLDSGTGGLRLDQGATEVISSVAGPGDLNGDGLGEVVMATWDRDGDDPNRTYVIFGTEGTPPTLAEVRAGTGGFVIEGTAGGLDGAGDVNGDGVHDVVIDGYGGVIVVFGKADTEPVQAEDVRGGDGGFLINPYATEAPWPFIDEVKPAGDINGDGLDDLVLDIYDYGAEAIWHLGRTYVVFGKQDTEEVWLSDADAGDGGFLIEWLVDQPRGCSLSSSVGDQNGDGLADIANNVHGEAMFVLGRTDTSPVLAPDITLPELSVYPNVAGGQDVNADGLPDFVMHASCPAVVFGGNLEPRS